MPGTILRRYIREDGSLRLTIREEDEDGIERRRVYSLPPRVYEAWGSPAAGDAVSDEALFAFAEAEGEMHATEKALSLLSYSDNSCAGLCRKLRAKGYGKEAAEAAVAHMLASGYIKEDEQARRLVIVCARRKLWGRRRILSYLRSRGYDSETAARAIAEAENEGEIDFAASAALLLEKKAGEGADARTRRAILYRYGY